jgi:hypothetical protein
MNGAADDAVLSARKKNRRCHPEPIRRGWAKDLNAYFSHSVRVGILLRTGLTSYHRARMRYFNTDSPLAFTGTLNCAANASVFFAS